MTPLKTRLLSSLNGAHTPLSQDIDNPIALVKKRAALERHPSPIVRLLS